MAFWRDSLITKDGTILTALEKIQAGGMCIAFVVDGDNKLLGVVADSDIRRALIKGASLSDPVHTIMNSNPAVASTRDHISAILAVMAKSGLSQIPVLDDHGRMTHVEFLGDILRRNQKENMVVVMAGGLGTRLRPMTENMPKPMLPVGGKPMLEIILDNLIKGGFHRFAFAVNFKAEVIENHFGDGKKWGVEITYLKENKRLGTAGAIGMLPRKPEHPLLIINGDVIANISYTHLLEFQARHRAQAVMCVREYSMQVPYGVVETEGDLLLNIVEKPVHTHYINAGIYLLAPDMLDLIPENEFFDMPSLFQCAMESQRKTMVYPITDLWFDVGRKEDLDKVDDMLGKGFLNHA